MSLNDCGKGETGTVGLYSYKFVQVRRSHNSNELLSLVWQGCRSTLGWDTKTSFIFGYNLLLILDRHPRVTWSNPVINYRGYNGLQKYQRKSYAILFLATSANHMIDWFHNIKYYSCNIWYIYIISYIIYHMLQKWPGAKYYL